MVQYGFNEHNMIPKDPISISRAKYIIKRNVSP